MKFGLLAPAVLSSWGVIDGADLGRIVFAMVDQGLLTREPTDCLEQFEVLPSLQVAAEFAARAALPASVG